MRSRSAERRAFVVIDSRFRGNDVIRRRIYNRFNTKLSVRYNMNATEQIRKHCLEKYVEPARMNGKTEFSICAGDVSKDLKMGSKHASVCSAIGSHIFEEMSKVKRKAVEGPLNQPKTVLVFEIL